MLLTSVLVTAMAASAPDHRHLLAGKVCEVACPADNSTIANTAIEAAIHACQATGTVFFRGPGAYRIDRSVVLASDTTLLLDKNTSLFSAITPDMPVVQDPRCATLYW
jgi:polygalacturonase